MSTEYVYFCNTCENTFVTKTLEKTSPCKDCNESAGYVGFIERMET